MTDLNFIQKFQAKLGDFKNLLSETDVKQYHNNLQWIENELEEAKPVVYALFGKIHEVSKVCHEVAIGNKLRKDLIDAIEVLEASIKHYLIKIRIEEAFPELSACSVREACIRRHLTPEREKELRKCIDEVADSILKGIDLIKNG